jgi:hypothetical protein
MEGKKILLFKGEKYGFLELLDKYTEDIFLDKFKCGIVKNLERDEEFDISNIVDVFLKLNQDLDKCLNHLSYSQKSRIKSNIDRVITKTKIKELYKKLDEDLITKEELEMLFILEDRRDIKTELKNNRNSIKEDIINTNFIKVSQESRLPDELSITDVGRYHRLLELVVNKNTIHHSNHGNSKEMKMQEVMKYIDCSKSTFKTFIQKMEKLSIIRRYRPVPKRWVLFINPIYAHRDLYINNELYNVFKDVLEEKLDRKVLKYLEFVYSEDENTGSISISEE